MSKGDRPRPIRDRERYNRNWERIFGDGDDTSVPPEDERGETMTYVDKCHRNATPDPDINPAEWEDKQDE